MSTLTTRTTFQREELRACLRRLHQQLANWLEDSKLFDPDGATAHGIRGQADGIAFAIEEVGKRFGIEWEEIEEGSHADSGF